MCSDGNENYFEGKRIKVEEGENEVKAKEQVVSVGPCFFFLNQFNFKKREQPRELELALIRKSQNA